MMSRDDDRRQEDLPTDEERHREQVQVEDDLPAVGHGPHPHRTGATALAAAYSGPMAWGVRGVACALVAAVAALAPAVAGAAAPPGPGRTTAGTVTSNGTGYDYLLYTPTSVRRGQ